jgi:hypothetical protein
MKETLNNEYKVIKKYTHDYYDIDKQMFLLTLYNIYKNTNDKILFDDLKIGENIYVSLLDLPIIKMTDKGFLNYNEYFSNLNYYFLENNKENVTEKFKINDEELNLLYTIKDSIDSFFIIYHNNVYYLSRIKYNAFNPIDFHAEIAEYNLYNRLNKLKIFDDI